MYCFLYCFFISFFAEIFRSFDHFSNHLCTNAIGPIICAQKLLKTGIPIGTLIFMSSDSGSAGNFRAFEDGFVIVASLIVTTAKWANQICCLRCFESCIESVRIFGRISISCVLLYDLKASLWERNVLYVYYGSVLRLGALAQ